jgi:hypothetical protein
MIDALLYAVQGAIWDGGLGYSRDTARLMDGPEPPADAGDVFVSIHQDASKAGGYGRLDEMFGFVLTLSMRLRNIPLDRVGDSLLAVKLARETGFNRRAEALRAYLHENWDLLYTANNYLLEVSPGTGLVWGFSEPPRYHGEEVPMLVGPEWFGGEPDSGEVGLKADLSFGDCRRFQGVAHYV